MNIVLVWCWWIGLSAIWLILKKLGYNNIVWIDSTVSQVTKNLENHWIKVIIWHWIYNVNKNDFVIYSDAAINSPEVKASLEFMSKKDKHYHRPFSYFEFVWEISKYFRTIAVAGTHWKSTTTSMLITSLSKLNNNFALWIVGALVPQLWGDNFFLNTKKLSSIKKIFDHILKWDYVQFDHKLIKKFIFAIEADEFNMHFLHLDADVACITNMQLDHSDVYKTFWDYSKTFEQFVWKVREKVFVLKSDDVVSWFKHKFWTKIKPVATKKFAFKCVFWDHNNLNATLVYNIIKYFDPEIETDKLLFQINSFKWLRRRMELLKKFKNWWILYTDYWHHPWELAAVYSALKKYYKDKKLIAIFQPHQARRVIEFWDDFIDVLKKFDENYIYDIYIARENIIDLIKIFKKKALQSVKTVEQLWKLFAKNTSWEYYSDFSEISNLLSIWSDSIVVVFTAWDLDYKIRNYFYL